MHRALLPLAIFAALVAVCAAAPPKVDYLFPAGAARGESATVTAGGSFSNWPVNVWVDRPGVSITPAEKKGELTVSVDPDAGFGVYWLRLYDAEGASVMRPLLVGGLPESVDVEPNNAPQEAQPISVPTVVNGKLEKREDVDGFVAELKQGDTLVASLAAHRQLGSPMDAVLQICDRRGFVLAQNDDARGLDPLIVFSAPADGQYVVRTFAFPETPTSSIRFASGDNFVYRLSITTAGYVDHCLPLAVAESGPAEVRLFGWGMDDSLAATTATRRQDGKLADVFAPAAAGFFQIPVTPYASLVASDESSPEAPQAIETPLVVSGRIEAENDVDAFSFPASKGNKLSLRVESRSLGFPLDPVLTVVDEAGKVLAEEDDASREQRDAALTLTPPADGAYIAKVRDLNGFGGLRYAYRLTIAPHQPDYELKLAAGEYLLAPGNPLEIKVEVNRRDGFDGEIEITAVDLPQGVAVEAAKSEAKGNSSKEVKLKLTAESGPASGAMRIVGRIADRPELERSAVFAAAGENANQSSAWLTVAAPKDAAKKK